MSDIAINPVVLSTTSPRGLAEDNTLFPAASQTWKKGQLAEIASGVISEVSSSSTTVYGIFVEDRDVKADTTEMKLQVLKIGTILAMYVVDSSGNSAAETTVTIGDTYACIETSGGGVTGLNKDGTTGQFKVVAYMSDKRPFEYATTDSPGLVTVEFLGSTGSI